MVLQQNFKEDPKNHNISSSNNAEFADERQACTHTPLLVPPTIIRGIQCNIPIISANLTLESFQKQS
jgi:hypothetical protein